MFHKYALLINCTLLTICVIFSCWPMNLFKFTIQFQFSDLLLYLSFIVLFLFISFLFLFIISLITEVKVGHSPLDSLTIAYKYGLSNSLSSSVLLNVHEHFPTNEKVQICYERRVGPFGIAYGAIIHSGTSEISEETKVYISQHGYRLLQTKPISNAMYISCPRVPWLSYLGVWLTLRIIYPKIYKYSKKHTLSAYPVVEVYGKYSTMLMAPLSRQDYFVVPEAEMSLRRSSSCFNLLFSSVENRSNSTNPSRSKSTNLSVTAEVDNNTIELTADPIHSSILKLTNGTTRQG